MKAVIGLSGSIRPAGNKNAALPLLAASLLTSEPVTLRNIPDIGDVRTKLALLAHLGVYVDRPEANVVHLRADQLIAGEPDTTLARRIRTSPLLAGPLLARRGYVTLPRPGGDAIGRRRLDTHLLALQALGVQVEVTPASYILTAKRPAWGRHFSG
ncbi:MAG: hypothetical protein KatS3mg056_1193 [Chloroflexus sp.]|nr:MAG: hypothetical protein KatS3mg056_1193 [Chloroflexus sp.]